MLKQEVYQLAGSNCENLGSDLEFKLKQASAQTEHAWQGVGQHVGLRIWRIEKFHVIAWPEDRYGQFYNGDSYIVLNTWKDEGGELHYDLHFWLGQNTTMDEAGTAAYKTVELDTFLDDKPIQHREVEGYESELFMTYFKKGVFILDGGIDSGFFHVVPEKHRNRLMRIKGVFRHLHVRSVPVARENLNSGDVFIMDLGNVVYQFNGAKSGGFEKHKAAEIIVDMKHHRNFQLIVIDELEDDNDDAGFWPPLGGKGPIPVADTSDSLESKKTTLVLHRLSDRTGHLTTEKVAEGGDIKPNLFQQDDVFLLDKGYIMYVWVGAGASKEEKKSGMSYAQKYITQHHGGLPLPITIIPGSDSHGLQRILGH
jgi:gelsolin